MATITYRYELRQGDHVIATGHLTQEHPIHVGQHIEIAGHNGIVTAADPTLNSEHRLVVTATPQQPATNHSRPKPPRH